MTTVPLRHRDQSFSLEVHEGEYIGEAIRSSAAFYEANLLEFLATNFPAQKTIVDIGANIGNHTLFFAAILQPTRLVAFEPEPSNFRLLTQNLANRAELHQVALGAGEGFVECITAPENKGVVFLRPAPQGIPLRTLDSFGLTDVTLIKLDVVEGYLAVLDGAQRTLETDRPVLVVHGRFNEIYPKIAALGYVGLKYWPEHNSICFCPIDRIPKGL